tara:strand:+ start:1379 stop:2155 length:777 start_codon:yes stop_codon:yes gene_type:complete
MKTAESITHITNWLKSYSDKSNTDGFVVGISGGIDSAVTSALCALTNKKVLCILMPIHQHQMELDRSKEHVEWLLDKFENVSVCEVNLTSTFDTLSAQIPADIKGDLTMANTRARLRMTTLYTYAGAKGMLVAGTGNKIEDFGVGFFTKYGDGGVDISPIADLMKSEIYKVAEKLNIANSIQKAAPTDGLWADGRSDEEQLGATYEELEWAMCAYEKSVENNYEGRKQVVFNVFSKLHQANLHKMQAIPVCNIPSELK